MMKISVAEGEQVQVEGTRSFRKVIDDIRCFITRVSHLIYQLGTKVPTRAFREKQMSKSRVASNIKKDIFMRQPRLCGPNNTDTQARDTKLCYLFDYGGTNRNSTVAINMAVYYAVTSSLPWAVRRLPLLRSNVSGKLSPLLSIASFSSFPPLPVVSKLSRV